MKKFLLLLLPMIALVATGAFAEGDPETASTSNPKLELTLGWYFDGGSASDNVDEKEMFEEWFAEYFNVDLKVNPLSRESYMQSLSLQAMSGDIQGFMSLFGGSYIQDFYNDGASLNLMPLLKDNANYKKLPPLMQNTYQRGNVLLAITTSWRDGLPYTRSIRTDWLDNLGLDMPETVDEFYEVIKAFTEDDPDNNGKDDTIGMTSSGVWMMNDIFSAFGVPTNHVMDHCITPDPHEDFRFNDGFLKPGMKPALEWLRKAYSNGYIDQEIFTNNSSAIRTKMYSGKYGSVTYSNSWGLWTSLEAQINKVEEKPSEVGAILGLKSDYAQEYLYAGGIQSGGHLWSLSSNTENPSEMANLFVDIFLGDDIGFWSGYYGVYKKMWDYGEDGEIVLLAKDWTDDGKIVRYKANNVTRAIAGTDWDVKVTGLRVEKEAEETYQNRFKWYQIQADTLKYGVENKIYFGGYPHWWSEPTSDTYNKIGADIKIIFDEMVAAAVTGSMTVDEAIASYKKQVGDLGGQMMLDEANAAIGKTSSTQWRF